MGDTEEEPNLSPMGVEQHIWAVSNRIAKSAAVCNDLLKAFLEADRLYDAAYARAYVDADGPAHEKRYRAELDTQEERKARDVADAAYRYADRLSKALIAELGAFQSINKSVLATFGAAGVGER